MKVCTVPLNEREKCLDIRGFNTSVMALTRIIDSYRDIEEKKKEIKETLEHRNKFCEKLNCPYLKELKEVLK